MIIRQRIIKRMRNGDLAGRPDSTTPGTRFQGNKTKWAAEKSLLPVLMVLVLLLPSSPVEAQQFNTDNYWTAPHGVGTFIATVGQYYSAIIGTAALFPGWEFTLGATLYEKDEEANSTDHFSVTAYVKHMFYENESKTGGWAVMGGTGIYPGYLKAGTVTDPLRSYWVAAPVTIPFFDGTLSWDIMPGATLNFDYGRNDEATWGLTYSTRLALYKVIPQSAIVGEVFGTEGDAYSKPQYRVGVRWEPSQHVVIAATYGGALDSSRGAGFEIGVMLFTPPFLCFGGCK